MQSTTQLTSSMWHQSYGCILMTILWVSIAHVLCTGSWGGIVEQGMSLKVSVSTRGVVFVKALKKMSHLVELLPTFHVQLRTPYDFSSFHLLLNLCLVWICTATATCWQIINIDSLEASHFHLFHIDQTKIFSNGAKHFFLRPLKNDNFVVVTKQYVVSFHWHLLIAVLF